MSAGASGPELVVVFISICFTHSSLGIGTVIGSEVSLQKISIESTYSVVGFFTSNDSISIFICRFLMNSLSVPARFWLQRINNFI
jgi:Ca2+/Na+ antiporter